MSGMSNEQIVKYTPFLHLGKTTFVAGNNSLIYFRFSAQSEYYITSSNV